MLVRVFSWGWPTTGLQQKLSYALALLLCLGGANACSSKKNPVGGALHGDGSGGGDGDERTNHIQFDRSIRAGTEPLSVEYYTRADPQKLLEELRALMPILNFTPKFRLRRDPERWELARSFTLPPPTVERDGLHVCNVTPWPLQVAFGFQEQEKKKNWFSRSSIHLDSGACYSPAENYLNQNVYVYARTVRDAGSANVPNLEWRGAADAPQFCVHPQEVGSSTLRSEYICGLYKGQMLPFTPVLVNSARYVHWFGPGQGVEAVPIRQSIPGYYEWHLGRAYNNPTIYDRDWSEWMPGNSYERNRFIARSLLDQSLLKGYPPAAIELTKHSITNCLEENSPQNYCYLVWRIAAAQGELGALSEIADVIHGAEDSPLFNIALAIQLQQKIIALDAGSTYLTTFAEHFIAVSILDHYPATRENLEKAKSWLQSCSGRTSGNTQACARDEAWVDERLSKLP